MRSVALGQSGVAVALLGKSDDSSANGSRVRLGSVPSLRISPKISAPSSLAWAAFQPLTYGESNSSTKPTPRRKTRTIEISWTKNFVILERCKESAERQFYPERTKQFGWTKNILIHQPYSALNSNPFGPFQSPLRRKIQRCAP